MPSTPPLKHTTTTNNPRQTFPPFLIPSFPGHAQTCAAPVSLSPRSNNNPTRTSPAPVSAPAPAPSARGQAKFELQYPTIDVSDSQDRRHTSRSSSGGGGAGTIRQPPASTQHVVRKGGKIELQCPTVELPDSRNRRIPPAPTHRALKSKPEAKFELQFPNVNVPGSSPRSTTYSHENAAASFPPASSPFTLFKRSFQSRSLDAGVARLDAVLEVEEIENVNVSEKSGMGSFVRKKNGKGKKVIVGQEERDGSGSGSTVSLESIESGG